MKFFKTVWIAVVLLAFGSALLSAYAQSKPITSTEKDIATAVIHLTKEEAEALGKHWNLKF